MKKTIDSLRAHKRWLKWIPNGLTICNSLCGFAAIVTAIGYNVKEVSGDVPHAQMFALSAWLILGAMIFDCLDGFAARLLDAASMHGIQMDSLADMVTFGVAPATLITAMTYSMKSMDFRHALCVWILAAVYLGCAALRLATYNVHAIVEHKSSETFSGMPSPAAAAGICTTVILYEHCKIALTDYWWVFPVYAALLGLLMVSSVPYLHFGKWLVAAKHNKKRLYILAAILICCIWNIRITAFVFVNFYILFGLAAAGFRALTGKKRSC